jgi:hypothetical protein
MARILFYMAILVAGGILALVVAEAYMSVAARMPGDVALEGPYALRNRPWSGGECDAGPQILGLPVRELAVGAVVTMFGMLMQSVGGRMLKRG